MSKIFDKISFWSLFITIVSLPVFFLPFTKIPIDISKDLILVLGLSSSIIFWAIARFFDGKIILPKSWVFYSGLIVVFLTFLASVFSSAFGFSLFGTMLDIGSFFFVLVSVLLMIFSTIVFNNEKKVDLVFKGIMISFIVSLLFQFARLFLPQFLSFGVLADSTSNLIGNFNSFGFFAGLVVLFSVMTISFVRIPKFVKYLLFFIILISLGLIILANFSLIWIILGSFALFIFIYKISFVPNINAGSSIEGIEMKRSRFPVVPFLIVVISIFFLLGGRNIGNIFSSYFGVSNVDIRPSITATFNVAQDVIVNKPIFGMGPNSFSNAWDLYKPNVVNNTDFWSTSFEVGSGVLPTYMLTTGIIGILAWVLFLVTILIFSFKILFLNNKKNLVNLKTILFLILAIYLFIASFFYAVSPVLLLLAFIFLGIAIGASGSIKLISIQFLTNTRKNIIAIIVLIILILVAVSASFKYTERFISISYFQKTISAQSLELAEKNINKAVALYSNDLYLRTYAQVYLLKFKTISLKGEDITEEEKVELKNSFDQAIKSGELAVNFNKNSYLNFKSLGMIYEFFTAYGVQNADQMAIEAYKTAASLNPQNPSLKLDIARAYLVVNNITEAKNYALQAFELKKDYVDAMFMISQILKKEGNNADALKYAQLALSYNPTNAQLSEYVDSFGMQSDLSGSTKDEKKKSE